MPLFTDTLLVSAQSHHGPLGLAYSVLDKLDFLLLPQPLETLTLGDFAQTSSVFTEYSHPTPSHPSELDFHDLICHSI